MSPSSSSRNISKKGVKNSTNHRPRRHCVVPPPFVKEEEEEDDSDDEEENSSSDDDDDDESTTRNNDGIVTSDEEEEDDDDVDVDNEDEMSSDQIFDFDAFVAHDSSRSRSSSSSSSVQQVVKRVDKTPWSPKRRPSKVLCSHVLKKTKKASARCITPSPVLSSTTTVSPSPTKKHKTTLESTKTKTTTMTMKQGATTGTSTSKTNRHHGETLTNTLKSRSNLSQHEEYWEMKNGGYVTETTMTLTKPKGDNFLSYLFGESRLRVLKLKQSEYKTHGHLLQPTFVNNGGEECTLVCAKAKTEKIGGGHYSNYSNETLTLTYVVERGISSTGQPITPISVQKLLERLGNFEALEKHKQVARLTMFQSKLGKTFWRSLKEFRFISEKHHVGCGFISSTLLDELYPQQAKSGYPKQALQVRIFHPKLGCFKGMLLRKSSNEEYIELPSSMKKVEGSCSSHSKEKNKKGKGSRDDDEEEEVFLGVTQQGCHPTSFNVNLGKFLSRQKVPQSFLMPGGRTIKLLSPMIQRIMVGLGCNYKEFRHYRYDSARSPHDLQHAWLVGVTDPLKGKIPEGYIVVPGLPKGVEQVFITRSPCMEASDAKVLRVLRDKPKTMSPEEWTELQSYQFGTVIFANPKDPKEPSLPECIANGDLDGDLYFICWNKRLVKPIYEKNQDRVSHVLGAKVDPQNRLWCRMDWFVGQRTWCIVNQEFIKQKKGALIAAQRFCHDQTSSNNKKKKKGNTTVHCHPTALQHLKELLQDASLSHELTINEIAGHQKHGSRKNTILLNIKWNNYLQYIGGNDNDVVETQEPLEIILDKFPKDVVHYVQTNKLLNQPGFQSVVKYLRKQQQQEQETTQTSVAAKASRGTPDIIEGSSNDNKWFDAAQDCMLNLARRDQIRQFICTLYKLCLQMSKTKLDQLGYNDLDAPAAIAFGRAFKDSLDIEKHNIQIQIQSKYRCYLDSTFWDMCEFY